MIPPNTSDNPIEVLSSQENASIQLIDESENENFEPAYLKQVKIKDSSPQGPENTVKLTVEGFMSE